MKILILKMCGVNKIRGFVAMPIIIISAVLAVGVLGGLAYEYKNNQSVLSSVNKNNLLAQAYGGTTPTISILSPNGGESLQIGSQYTISISGMDANSPMFGIYLFKGGVQNLNKLGSIEGDGVVQYSSGYKDGFIWNIGKYGTYDVEGTQTASPGSDYYICLVTNSGILDCSNAPFTISSVPAPTIKVLSPNGGETYKIGNVMPIQWSAQNPPAGYVAKIGLQSVQTGLFVDSPTQGYCNLAGGCVALTAGSINYSISASVAPGSYKIVIDCWKANSEVSDCSASDSSDAPFTISSVPAPTIKVLSPNGGETFQQGQTHSISWQTNESSAPIGIYLSGFDEFGGTYIVGTILGKGGGSYLVNGENYYNWQVPTTTVIPGKYLIRVVAYPEDKSKTYEDSSDRSFVITAPQPTCSASTSCVPQYCQYGGDLKKCTVKKTDCSTSSYTTGGCKAAPSISTVCDSTAKAIVDSVGGCTKIDRSLYSNIYDVCCVPAVVTEQSLLSMLNTALADRFIDKQEATALLIALNSYLK